MDSNNDGLLLETLIAFYMRRKKKKMAENFILLKSKNLKIASWTVDLWI